MPARDTSSAACIEFGSNKAVSNRPLISSAPSAGHRARLPIPAGFGRTIVSSQSGTSSKSGAIAGRAAMVIDASGAARRTSAIAGSAMTASPSQFGERMTRRFIVWYGRVARVQRAYHDRRARRSRARAVPSPMKIALLQVNPTVGDVVGNARKILDALRAATDAGADLAATPELALVGYLPRDLLLSPEFVNHSWNALETLAGDAAALAPVLVGVPEANPSDEGRPLFNAAALLRGGRVEQRFRKALLPTYDVFDEDRYFEPFHGAQVLDLAGTRVGISICEDIWNDRDFWKRRRYHHDPVEELVRAGATAIVNLSASPFTVGKHQRREEMLSSMARKYRVPLVYVNQYGGNDDLVFDGRSCGFAADGSPIARGASFDTDVVICDMSSRASIGSATDLDPESEVWRALVTGTRDYARKCGFSRVVLGLSGGIDSALTAAVAAEALGPRNVLGVLMPSPFSSQGSIDDSLSLAGNIGIETLTL